MKILIQGDSPIVSTGFGRVMKNLTKALLDQGHELEMVGVNHFQFAHDPRLTEQFPFRIEGLLKERTGDPQGFQVLVDLLKKNEYDLVFVLNDLPIVMAVAQILTEFEIPRQKKGMVGALRQPKRMPPLVAYMPIDTDFFHNLKYESASRVDHVIAYHENAAEIIKDRLPDIKQISHMHHGIDMREHKPPSRQQKKTMREKFGIDKDTLLLINVNRNQWRKDLAVSILAFLMFQHNNPNRKMLYYLHAAREDIGGDLNVHLNSAIALMNHFHPDFEFKNNVLFPDATNIPFEDLNIVYHCADAYITTTVGEGWGMGITEAMATNTPVFAPNNSSIPTILGRNEERGYIYSCGNTIDDWRIFYGANEFFRPMASPTQLSKKLQVLIDNPQDVQSKVKVAKEWAQRNNWNNNLKHFIKVINSYEK